IWRLAGPQISFGWAIGWGQYVVGVLLALLVITPFFGLPPMAGVLIEISFEGGHGTAAGLAGTFERLGFPEPLERECRLARVGLLSGLVIGIILINWAVRRNKTEIIKNVEGFSKLKKQGIMEFENREPAAKMTVRPESIEPLSFHFAIVGLAVLAGYLLLQFL